MSNDIPLTMAPSSLSHNVNQAPLNPVWPVTTTFLFANLLEKYLISRFSIPLKGQNTEYVARVSSLPSRQKHSPPFVRQRLRTIDLRGISPHAAFLAQHKNPKRWSSDCFLDLYWLPYTAFGLFYCVYSLWRKRAP